MVDDDEGLACSDGEFGCFAGVEAVGCGGCCAAFCAGDDGLDVVGGKFEGGGGGIGGCKAAVPPGIAGTAGRIDEDQVAPSERKLGGAPRGVVKSRHRTTRSARHEEKKEKKGKRAIEDKERGERKSVEMKRRVGEINVKGRIRKRKKREKN